MTTVPCYLCVYYRYSCYWTGWLSRLTLRTYTVERRSCWLVLSTTSELAAPLFVFCCHAKHRSDLAPNLHNKNPNFKIMFLITILAALRISSDRLEMLTRIRLVVYCHIRYLSELINNCQLRFGTSKSNQIVEKSADFPCIRNTVRRLQIACTIASSSHRVSDCWSRQVRLGGSDLWVEPGRVMGYLSAPGIPHECTQPCKTYIRNLQWLDRIAAWVRPRVGPGRAVPLQVKTFDPVSPLSVSRRSFVIKTYIRLLYEVAYTVQFQKMAVYINCAYQPNETDNHGRTALHYACMANKLAPASRLLGTLPHSARDPDRYGFTPLMYAAMTGRSTAVVRALITDAYEGDVFKTNFAF